MRTDDIYFRWFMRSLSESQKKDFNDASINQQKDWYISYLESHSKWDGGMGELQKFMDEIMVWSDATFPKSTTVSKLKHLIKEAGEVIKEVEKQDHTIDHAQRRRVREEFADVFILLLNALSSEGIHFGQLVEDAKAKMEINKTREWGTPDEDGVVEHKKGGKA